MTSKMLSSINKGPQEAEDEDPADYIFSNPECHDLYLTIRDPGTGQTERVGVASTQLRAHSSVLREIVKAGRLHLPEPGFGSTKPSSRDIIISDVSPATFKLMLRHMYGGRLPALTQTEAAQLAICADGYNVNPLLSKALKILKPKDVETVFPALITATSLEDPELEKEVAKIIQEQTDDLVRDGNFLHINTSSLLFIVKQEVLNITEVELWRNVVRWAESQVKQQPGKTTREVLQCALKHIRFLTFSVEEIANYVLPTKILTSDESVKLILTVTGNSSLEHTALCDISEKRILHQKDTEENNHPTPLQGPPRFTVTLVFNAIEHFDYAEESHNTHSNFTIFPARTLQIEQFFCKTLKRSLSKTDTCSSYRFTCLVNVEECEGRNSISKEVIIITVNAPFNNTATLHLKKKNGGSLILKANHLYKFCLEFDVPHPTHRLWNKGYPGYDKTTEERSLACMRLRFYDYFHVLKIIYKV